MVRKNLTKKLHRLHDLFRGVVDSLQRKWKNVGEKKELFLKELQTRFDVSAEVLWTSSKPTKLFPQKRKKKTNLSFLPFERTVPILWFIDVKRIKRFERPGERERIAATKAEKERKRQR
ncbi:Hypothetical protein FKW44_002765 [Caligus rogercresseyi]|uniref:Uncharacterized protein n=1 Tax=Caligus rogercresseyi TaxID=217165 RepID=A0A7T8QWI1_CALRO|nr:Hypothetical protein FKW44_002765 [Caligus rogercresseyi]